MKHNLHCVIALLSLAGIYGSSFAAEINYELKTPGRVSLGVFNGKGAMIRTLLRGRQQGAGRHTVVWDGLDRNGKPVAPGEYSWRMIRTDGLQAKYLFSLGTSFRERPWPGQHGGPVAVAFDGRWLYVAAGSSEHFCQLVRLSPDGRRHDWARKEYRGWATINDLAVDGDKLYAMHANMGKLVVAHADSGDAIVNINDGPLLGATVRRFDFNAAGGRTEPGWVGVPLVEHTSERGFGWRNIEGLTAGQSNVGGKALGDYQMHRADRAATADDRKTFVVDGLPPGEYTVHVHFGSGDAGSQQVNFAHGSGSNLKWHTTASFEPDGQNTATFGVSIEPWQQEGLELTFFNSLKTGAKVDWAIRGIEIEQRPTRIAVRDGAAWALCTDGVLLELDPDTGEIQQAVAVDSPMRDVELLPDGRLLGCARQRIVVVNANGQLAPLVENLIEPVRLSYDEQAKRLLVFDGGESQQVKVFDLSGHRLATFGRQGGRQYGRYVATDFQMVEDICGDGRGGFFVVETQTGPRRTAHFDAAGKLIDEWYGGQQFFTAVAVDPSDPTRVWIDTQWMHVMECEVDYERRTWRPRAVYNWAKPLVPALSARYKMGHPLHVLKRDLDADGRDETLLHSPIHGLLIYRVDEQAGWLRPLAVGSAGANWTRLAEERPDLYELFQTKAKQAGYDQPPPSFTWADADGGGEFDADDAYRFHRFDENPRGGIGTWSVTLKRIDEDWTAYHPWNALQEWRFDKIRNESGIDAAVEHALSEPLMLRLKPQGFTPLGAPIYDWADRELLGHGYLAMERVDALADADGSIYGLFEGYGDGFAAPSTYAPAHGTRWPSNLRAGKALIKFAEGGDVLWRVGPGTTTYAGYKPTRGAPPIPGSQYAPVRILGLAHDSVLVANRIVDPLQAWTSDGLYVGSFLDRRADDGMAATAYTWWQGDKDGGDQLSNQSLLQYDMLIGGDICELDAGKVLFFGAGWNNVPVYEISGWSRIDRLGGTVRQTITAAAPSAAGAGLHGEYFDNTRLQGKPVLVRTDGPLWFGWHGKDPPKWNDDRLNRSQFSARFTGTIEPRFTEDYRFFVYVGSGETKDRIHYPADKVRLWVDGKRIIDTFDVQPDPADRAASWRFKPHSDWIRLAAGRRVPVRLEYAATTGKPDLHLCWESVSQEIEHVPRECLYPAGK